MPQLWLAADVRDRRYGHVGMPLPSLPCGLPGIHFRRCVSGLPGRGRSYSSLPAWRTATQIEISLIIVRQFCSVLQGHHATFWCTTGFLVPGIFTWLVDRCRTTLRASAGTRATLNAWITSVAWYGRGDDGVSVLYGDDSLSYHS